MPNLFFKRMVLTAIVLVGSWIKIYSQEKTNADSTLSDRLDSLEKKLLYNKPGDDHVMTVGLATIGYAAIKSTNTLNGVSTVTKTNSLGDADHYEFSPMFLWRHGNKFLLEFEPSFSNNGLGVNWADVSYFATPNLIIRTGYLVLPFGTYSKRLAAGWIDKLATDPMGVADMAPTDYALEIEGGLPMGSMKMSYDIALSNGNQLLPDGELTSGNITDNNLNKTVTARLGFLPFSNSSLEIGASGMFGKVGDQESAFQNAKGNMYAFDLNYVKNLKPILLNIKAQYNIINISNEYYVSPVDSTQTYTFDNHSTAYFAQGSIRPVGLKKSPLKNFELAGRYTNYKSPANSIWGANQHSVSIGLDYWLSWRSVMKFTYENLKSNSTASSLLNAYLGNTNTNTFYLQFAIQL